MLQTLSLYFSYPFVRYAFIVGILISLCSSLLGVTLVLKRFSFIGDGLSHVAFGAIAIASVLNLTNNMLLVLPITIIAAILLLRTGQNAKIKGDAAIAMISVSSLAIGYLLMNIFSKSSNLTGDVCSTLFGSTSILTLTPLHVWLCVILSILVIAAFIIFYNKIFAVTFDETFAQAIGTHASIYNLVIAIIIAIIIVLAMNLVGSLLISALVIFPALSAMRIFKSFKSVTICSAIISVVCSALGLLISVVGGTPVGSTIVGIDLSCFLIFSLIGFLMTKRKPSFLPVSLILISLLLIGCSKNSAITKAQEEQTIPLLANSVIPTKESVIQMPDIPSMDEIKAMHTDYIPSGIVDHDLSNMNANMIFAEIFNLVLMPDEYIGRTFRMKGNFAVYVNETSGNKYFSIIIPDATQCCQQGIDIICLGDMKYPEDFPKIGSEIMVTGQFNSITTDEGLSFNYLVMSEEDFIPLH
ncbi:MAG: metal ABC transporter permease [Treponema sp.]|nr:metal ABC transporter permease [Treponema sp.]MDY3130915.1 metal ABC transporter permease [Treponema sp.]